MCVCKVYFNQSNHRVEIIYFITVSDVLNCTEDRPVPYTKRRVRCPDDSIFEYLRNENNIIFFSHKHSLWYGYDYYINYNIILYNQLDISYYDYMFTRYDIVRS